MRIITALVLVGIASGSAAAQTVSDFAALDVRQGERLYVTRPDGIEIGGPVTHFDGRVLTIDGFDFRATPGLKIERDGDSIWDGALRGASIGAFLGATVALEGCLGRSPWPCLATPTLEFGAIGAYIDWRMKGRTTIYGPSGHHRRQHAALMPSFTRIRKAVAVRLAF